MIFNLVCLANETVNSKLCSLYYASLKVCILLILNIVVPLNMYGSSSDSQFHSIDDGQSCGEQQEIEMVRGKVEELSLRQKTNATQERGHPLRRQYTQIDSSEERITETR